MAAASVSFVLLKTGRTELVQRDAPTSPSIADARAFSEGCTPCSDSERTPGSKDPMRKSERRGRRRNGQRPKPGDLREHWGLETEDALASSGS